MKFRGNPIGNDMQLGCIAVLFQLIGYELAGTVDMRKMVVENIPEPPVQGLVSQLHVAQAYGEGYILRLDMKGRCMAPGQF